MAELRPYNPTWRDKLASALMGDARPGSARANMVEGLTGSRGIGPIGMGLADFTPVGAVLGAQEAAQSGDYRGAAMNAMFLGPAAKTANRTALTQAEKMAAGGASREEIWNKTGWFQGPDAKWRFEIDDSKIPTKFVPNEQRLFEYPTVNQYVPHKELFNAYPSLKDVRMAPELKPTSMGTFDVEQNVMSMRPVEVQNFTPKAGEQSKAVVLHEMQHAVQAKEGFGRGGSPTEFMQQKDAELARDALAFRREVDRLNMPPVATWKQKENEVSKLYQEMGMADFYPNAQVRSVARDVDGNPNPQLEEITKLYGLDRYTTPYSPRELYHRLAGEVEARNVEKRMNMTPEQRRAAPPWVTQDVPFAEQILRAFGGK